MLTSVNISALALTCTVYSQNNNINTPNITPPICGDHWECAHPNRYNDGFGDNVTGYAKGKARYMATYDSFPVPERLHRKY